MCFSFIRIFGGIYAVLGPCLACSQLDLFLECQIELFDVFRYFFMLGCCFGLNNFSQKYFISLEKQESSIYIRLSGGAVVRNICFLYEQSNHLKEKMSKKLNFQTFIHKSCHNTPLSLYPGYGTEIPSEPLDCVKISIAHGPVFYRRAKKRFFFSKIQFFDPPPGVLLPPSGQKKKVF